MNGKTYIVYGYRSGGKMGYVIKEKESNAIVYEDSEWLSPSCAIDSLYWLDDGYVLIVERNGLLSTGRSAFVVNAGAYGWTRVAAFQQSGSGTRPTTASKKDKYHHRRCELTVTEAPAAISYNPATKTMSYTRYSADGHCTTVEVKWEHHAFCIDDWNPDSKRIGTAGSAISQ